MTMDAKRGCEDLSRCCKQRGVLWYHHAQEDNEEVLQDCCNELAASAVRPFEEVMNDPNIPNQNFRLNESDRETFIVTAKKLAERMRPRLKYVHQNIFANRDGLPFLVTHSCRSGMLRPAVEQ